MPALSLAQTLHGYDGGHRLLAKGGDVEERELAVLDRLSDLSGYLPPGTTFDAYWSGFPCGRHYAFACTWLDTAAARGGTVLTHTLLMPLSALGELPDLGAISTAFRRPISPGERAPYERSLVVSISPEPPPPLDLGRARGIVALLFGQPERPILWLDDEPAEDVIRYSWSLLWPEARRAFAFCSFALQPRSVDGRPFDLLALPETAKNAFHGRGTTGWWERGKLKPAVRVLADDAWTTSVVEAGPSALGPALALIRERALPMPKPWLLREVQRIVDLAAPASRDLTAARARADLVFWVWPDETSHPLAAEVMGTLLDRQAAAPFEPRPLRELRDVVSRKAALDLARSSDAFSRKVAETLRGEVGRRLSRDPGRVAADLAPLLEATPRPDWKASIVMGVCDAAARGGREPVLRTVVTTLPPGLSADLFERAGELAFDWQDVQLAFELQNVLGAPEAGLEEAARVARMSGELDKIRDLAEVSARAPRPLAVERLKREPDLALPFVRLAVREGPPAALFLETALQSLRLEDALSPELCEDLDAAGDVSWSARVADHIAPAWVRAAGRGSLLFEDAAVWLLSRPLRGAIERATPGALFAGETDVGSWLGPLSRILWRLVETARFRGFSGVVEPLLGAPLDQAGARSLDDSAPALGALLGMPVKERWHYAIAAKTLEAVRRTGARGACLLVERSFPIVYPTLATAGGAAFSIFWPPSWFTASWDRARPWRAWLVEIWLQHRWPPDAFLRSLGSDRALFRRLVRRLARTRDGLAFLGSLPAALEKDPALRQTWAHAVEQALEDPDSPVDYE